MIGLHWLQQYTWEPHKCFQMTFLQIFPCMQKVMTSSRWARSSIGRLLVLCTWSCSRTIVQLSEVGTQLLRGWQAVQGFCLCCWQCSTLPRTSGCAQHNPSKPWQSDSLFHKLEVVRFRELAAGVMAIEWTQKLVVPTCVEAPLILKEENSSNSCRKAWRLCDLPIDCI